MLGNWGGRRNFDAGLSQHRHHGGLDRVQDGFRAGPGGGAKTSLSSSSFGRQRRVITVERSQ
jgi:hypothetical protein